MKAKPLMVIVERDKEQIMIKQPIDKLLSRERPFVADSVNRPDSLA